MNNEIQKLTHEILEKGYLLSLGTNDDQGVWVADVIYTFDENFNLYWMSKPERRHSQALKKNPTAACTITITQDAHDPDMGLQIVGTVEQIELLSFDLVCKYFRKCNDPEPRPDEDVLGEHLWYKLTPQHIELIYQPTFGYQRQRVI